MKNSKKTKTLLHQALGLNSQERTLLLEQIDDSEIKSQLETLLTDEPMRKAFLAKLESEQLKPGSRINRIRIEKLLGQGGMGSVYLGFDEKLERQVAVKSIRSEYLQNKATQQRFVREAQILSKINHPSICHIYDYIESDQGDYLVLEYIKGKMLYQAPLSDSQKLDALVELATALAKAHEHGIVHRDLKPDNIMITDDGQLKVLDFGIAQSISKAQKPTRINGVGQQTDLTQQGSLVGTIRYMSPEQAQGKPIHTASDIYAMGVIAQEVFSHQPAYQIMETDQLLIDVQQGKRQSTSDIDEPIQALIEQLTQLDETERPTAQAVIQMVQSIQQAPKRKKLTRIKWAVVGVAVLLLTVLVWQWQQFSQQANNNKLISEYSEQIDELVKQGEQIYVLPIHPVTTEVETIYHKAATLFGQIGQDQHLSDAAKKRLQGIILLEAESYDAAIPLLQEGQAESALLAKAWSYYYIEKATELSDSYGFEEAMKNPNLKKNYLQPAINFIEQSKRDSGTTDPVLEAFLLSQTASLEAGLKAINQTLEAEHWNKDAVKIKGIILYALTVQARQKGQWELAHSYSLMTAETYNLSTQMARSYPYDYYSLCQINFDLMKDGVIRSGQGVDLYAEKAITACGNYLITQPGAPLVMNILSGIYMMKGQWEISLGINAQESLVSANLWNQKAVEIEDSLMARLNRALVLSMEAQELMLRGQVAQPKINAALVLFEEALLIETEQQPLIISDMLFVLAQQALEQYQHGHDYVGTVARAQELFDQAMLTENLMVSEQQGLIVNMGEVLKIKLIESYDQKQDVVPLAKELIGFLNPKDNPLKNEPNMLFSLASIHYLMAEYLHQQKRPIDNQLDVADQYIKQVKKINPQNQLAIICEANIKSLNAARTDQDFSEATMLYNKALDLNPNHSYAYQAWAESLQLQANTELSGPVKTALIKQGIEKINQALTINGINKTSLNTQQELLKMAQNMGVSIN